MKKQILFLTMLSLAFVFAGIRSYGQYQTAPSAVPTCLTPQPLTSCPSVDALHPVQGVMYTYTVNTTSASDDVRWFVVNNLDITSAGDSLVERYNVVLPRTDGRIDPADGTGTYVYALGTNNQYNLDAVNADGTGISSDGTVAHSIDISWKFFDGNSPNEVLLVGVVEDDAGCTDNIAVYRIIPQPAFTVDIAVLSDIGDSIAGPLDPLTGECVSPIESAVYAGGTTTPDGTLTVDYGENWVFYIVNGANYIDSWMPEFQISYAGGTAPTAEASWAYLTDATSTSATDWNTLSGTLGGTWTTTNAVIAGASAASPGTVGAGTVPAAGGECIVVRVRLDWGTTIEHDQTAGTLTFAVDGTSYDGDNTTGTFFDNPAYDDLHYVDCLTDGFINDEVNYEITPRPQIEEGTPTQEIKTGQGTN